MQHCRAIIFDFDGVILDSVDIKTRVFQTLFADWPEHLAAITDLHLRLGGISRFVKFDMIYRDILGLPLSPELQAELGDRFSRLVEAGILNCPMIAGAAEFLAAHAGSLPCFVASGTPQAELLAITKRRKLDAYFREIHGSPRDKLAIVRDLLARHSLAATDAVFVGDAMTDHEAAAVTGVRFIGIAADRSAFPHGTEVIPNLRGLASALGLEAGRAIDMEMSL